MNSEPARVDAEQKVAALMANVERLVAEQRDVDAQQLLLQAQAILPDHPLVLHERGRRLLALADPAGAHALFRRLVEIAPSHVPFWLSLAASLRVLGRSDEEFGVLERALALDPTHLVVLLQKGALLDLMNKPRSAAAVYGHALNTLLPETRLPPAVQAHVRHAQKRVHQNAALLAEAIQAHLGSSVEAEPSGERMRFDRCMDRLLGRKRIFAPEPTYMLFPFLRNYEFFPRGRFPWIDALEGAAPSIRQELLAVLAADGLGIEPYIAFDQGLPVSKWKELNHSRRWSAYFLWNQGREQTSHTARCPNTAAALSAIPQVEIAGRAPNAFFSMLEARTKIPAHTGVTNTRVTVHLPLVVPPGCGFRVGGETRQWEEGRAWVFDDTIEHEAWNDSNKSRAVLIFDIWNPELTALECDLIRETTIALAQYHKDEGDVPGVVI